MISHSGCQDFVCPCGPSLPSTGGTNGDSGYAEPELREAELKVRKDKPTSKTNTQKRGNTALQASITS